MNRVKMNAKHEYEFLANFKVLQNVFKAKRIDKVRANHLSSSDTSILFFGRDTCTNTHSQPVPVEKLVKCKMQYVPPPHGTTPSSRP